MGEKDKKTQIIREISKKNSPHLDPLYGFHMYNSELFLGNDPVKVRTRGSDMTYNVRGRDFPISEGLTSLLLHNEPAAYNERDLKAYKEMLVLTSAHKNNYNEKGKIKRNTDLPKYNNIIKGLFPPKRGKGMSKGGCMKKPQMKYNR